MATETIPAQDGHKKITFNRGGLHNSLNVPQGQKIPKSKLAAAMHGNAGKKAKAQAMFYENVLKH